MANERLPVVLVHGYSDKGESLKVWQRRLCDHGGYDVKTISLCNYQSLTNEITIKDLAEGFDRALKTVAHLEPGRPFSAIVHSTGMLVLRSWLTISNETERKQRRARLKHLIGLAPATFGSPLAHKGRSFLGRIFKGNNQPGPDFRESGDLILDGLELGSRFTWDLTHLDLLDNTFYDNGEGTPYVFIFCGTDTYHGIRKLVNEPGTDGTVRWAGCALRTEKFTVDMSRAAPANGRVRPKFLSENALAMPFWPIAGLNHGTIVSEPTEELVDLVVSALQVRDQNGFESWTSDARGKTAKASEDLEKRGEVWQQFVVRAMDERGDPISDFHMELFTKDSKGVAEDLEEFDLEVHAYSTDKSYRCFHVNVPRLKEALQERAGHTLWVRIIASSGSALVGYHGVGSDKFTPDATVMNQDGVWDAQLELPGLDDELFNRPFTTTFAEIVLNRDPTPFGQVANDICAFF